MASTDTFDDEPLTAAQAEGILTAPLDSPPAEPAPAPKRGRGRPPGSKNKPKAGTVPGAPPPAPGRRPRTTTRRPTAKGPTTEQKIVAAWGIPVALCSLFGSTLNNDALKADAITLDYYAAGAGKTLAPLADSSPAFASLLDRLSSGAGAPAVAAVMFGLSLGAQFAVNHGLIPVGTVASLGAVPRETLLQQPPASPATSVQEPEHIPVQDAEPQVTDPWAEGNLPPEWASVS